MHVLFLFVALVANAVTPENCMVGENHFYTSADAEHFPAVGSGEVNLATAEEIGRAGGVVFTIEVDRCSKQAASFIKYKAGKPVYGYYYRYNKEGHLVRLDLRYIDGQPTSQEVLDHI